nr:MAG: RNA-binding protein [Vulcanisaeta sp. AZ3]
MNIRIRGKYATALTKIALDLGFNITQPSEPIINRFNLKTNNKAPQITIKDSNKVPGGFVLIGKCDAIDKALNGILKTIENNALVWKSAIPLHRVIIGTIKEAKGENYLVDVGGIEAELRGLPGSYIAGDAILIHVVRTRVFSNDKIVIMPGVRIDTDHISIIPGNNSIIFSKHIKNHEAKTTLLEVALNHINELHGYNIKWRSSAQFLNKDEATREIKKAIEILHETEEKAKNATPNTILQEGECIVEVLPTGDAKTMLDNVRNNVTPTIIGHHTYKTLKRNTTLLDLIETLLTHCNDRVGFSKEFLTQLMNRRYKVGIIHIKPNGDVIKLGTANVIKLEPNNIVLLRKLRGGGYLDGLGLPKEEGDYAITCTTLGSNYLTHTYTDKNLKPKGIYININTPVEFTGNNILYIDLAIDIVKKWDSEKASIIDYEEYMNYVNMGTIPKKIQEKIETLTKELQEKAQEIGEECLNKAKNALQSH